MGSRAILLLLGLLLLSTELLAKKIRGFCNLPPDKGPCKGALTYYFYDAYDEICKPFRYGGCRGNSNRFKTEVACIRACIKKGRKK